MGVLNTIASKAGLSSLFNGTTSTPYNQDMIATSELTKGQKQFSTNSDRPNLPKPKTLFFTYFSLNPDLMTQTAIKKEMIKTLSSPTDSGVNGKQNSINDSLQSAQKKFMDDYINSTLDNKTANLLIKDNNDTNKFGTVDKSFKSAIDVRNIDVVENVDTMKLLSYEISKMVKKYKKPGIKFEVNEYNEYNRKRLAYKKEKYDDITITFFDVKENPVQRFFTTYLKFISNSFLCKGPGIWTSQVDTSHWYDGDDKGSSKDYNINPFGLSINSNFRLIDKICFCEYYQDKMTVYTIINPVIKSIVWGEGSLGDYKANDITVTFAYEGITNDLLDIVPYNVEFSKSADLAYLKSMVNSTIRKDMSKFLQTRYGGDTMTTVLTDAISFMRNVMNGEQKLNASSITSQVLDTASKIGYVDQVNSLTTLASTIQNYKNSDDKTKFVANMASDPTSVIGIGITQTSTIMKSLPF